MRGDLGITYDMDVLRLIDVFRGIGLYVGSVVLTQYDGQAAADAFLKRLTTLGIRCYRHYPIRRILPPTSPILSATRDWEKMITSKPAAPSSW